MSMLCGSVVMDWGDGMLVVGMGREAGVTGSASGIVLGMSVGAR